MAKRGSPLPDLTDEELRTFFSPAPHDRDEIIVDWGCDK